MSSKFTLALLAVSAISAQTTLAQKPPANVDEINRRSSERIHSELNADQERRQNRRRARWQKFNASMTNFASNFHLPGVEAHTLPEARELTAMDLVKIELLSCIDDIVRDHAGGYEGPKIAQDFLLQAMDQNGWVQDESSIRRATEDCQTITRQLATFPDRAIKPEQYFAAIQALPVTNAAENKTVSLLKNLYGEQKIACDFTWAEARAGFGPSIGVGIQRVRCLLSSGVVRVYAGPGLSVNLGFGAAVGVTKVEELEDAYSGEKNLKPGKMGLPFVKVYDGEKLVLTAGPIQYYGKDAKKHASIGLEVSTPAFSLGATLRSFNGKRHWDLLIDLLN